MKARTRQALALLMILLLPQYGTGLPWSDDMRDQPTVKPQEDEVSMPESSVPVSGKETLVVPKDLSELVRARLKAATLPNPVAANEESMAEGRKLYDLHCAVCHGAGGGGDGPVGKKYTPTPINLNLPYIQTQPDGQIFYTITNGSIQMPFYRDAMNELERWHLVNFVKHELAEE